MIHTVRALGDLLRSAGLAARPGAVTFEGPDDPILRSPYRIAAAGAAAIGATAFAAARLFEARGGKAQTIAVDTRRAAASLRSARYLRMDGKPPEDPFDPLTGLYRARDGQWIYVHCNFPAHRAGATALVGLSAEASREHFAAAIAARDAASIEAGLIAQNLPGGLVRPAEAWQRHPQAQALATLPLFEIVQIGAAAPVPFAPAARPLGDVRVLDLTRVLAGPTATRSLAEHGADVLKISGPALPHSGSIEYDTGLGKRAAFLDLARDADRARLLGLAAEADVFVQSYRPGALAARGFSPEALAARRPGIVIGELCAFGRAGPWATRRGFDTVVQALTGWAIRTGMPDQPALQPASPLDYVCGYTLSFGLIEALHRRATIGGSWLVRASLAQTARWIESLGGFADEEWRHVPAEFPEAEIAAWSFEIDAPAGRLRHLAPVARMSATPPHWTRPGVPLGTHSAAW